MTHTSVLVLSGPNKSARLDLSSSKFSVGLDNDNDIVLDDFELKPRHLIIKRLDTHSLRILEANGRFAVEAIPDPNDISRYMLPVLIRIGNTQLQFSAGHFDSAPAPSQTHINQAAAEAEIAKRESNDSQIVSVFEPTVDRTAAIAKTLATAISKESFSRSMVIAALFCIVTAFVFGSLNFLSNNLAAGAQQSQAQASLVPNQALRTSTRTNANPNEATQAFRAELERRNLQGIGVEASTFEMAAWGILPDNLKSDWSSAVQWYEGRYGVAFPLNSSVQFASESPLVKSISLITTSSPIGVYTKRGNFVEPGQTLADGWRLEEIKGGNLLLKKNNRTITLSLS